MNERGYNPCYMKSPKNILQLHSTFKLKTKCANYIGKGDSLYNTRLDIRQSEEYGKKQYFVDKLKKLTEKRLEFSGI